MEIHVSDLKHLYYSIVYAYKSKEVSYFVEQIADCLIAQKTEIQHNVLYNCLHILFNAIKLQPHGEKRADIMELYYILNNIHIAYMETLVNPINTNKNIRIRYD